MPNTKELTKEEIIAGLYKLAARLEPDAWEPVEAAIKMLEGVS